MLLAFLAGLFFVGILIYLPLGGDTPPGGTPAGGASSPFSPGRPVAPDAGAGPPQTGAAPASSPRLAIVIDDLGYEPTRDAAWLKFPAKITIAVIPFGTSSRKVAESARDRGFSVLLHVPMEPEGEVSDRTESFRLLRGMAGAEMEALLDRMLRDVPSVEGVSNHMGSAFTADPEAMALFAPLLKERKLFLLDSVTTDRSVAVVAALNAGIPAARRDLFLDVDPDPAAMRRRWLEAIGIAKKKGSAVLVCHGRSETLQALLTFLPDLEAEGIRAVTLSELLSGRG